MRGERDDARERAKLAEEDAKKLRAEVDRLRRIVEAKGKEVSDLKEQLKEAARIKNGDCGGRIRSDHFRCGGRCPRHFFSSLLSRYHSIGRSVTRGTSACDRKPKRACKGPSRRR